LPLLRERYSDAVLWLLIGGDSLRDFLSWHQPEEILRYARLAVLPRPGATPDWPALLAALPVLEEAVTFLDGPSVALSATQIRRWAAAGRGLNYLTRPAVREYIHHHRLYR
jgi:nicotinate-nucleotide adenylyltransferase